MTNDIMLYLASFLLGLITPSEEIWAFLKQGLRR